MHRNEGRAMINGINSLMSMAKINFKGHDDKQFRTTPMCNDCFVKSSNQEMGEFTKWAKQTDFLPQGLKNTLREENLLGKGFSNQVYKIDGNDDYVIRLRRSSADEVFNFSQYKIEDTEDKKLKGNYGQEVALIKSDDYKLPQIQVLKMQKGITNGNPPPAAIYEENGELRAGESAYEDRGRKEHYAQCLQILADMPQEAYEQLLSNVAEIGEAGYKFDYYNPNNFLLDEENQQINMIDLEKANTKYNNNPGNLLWALSNIDYLSTYMSSMDNVPIEEDDKNKAFENTITILDKYIKAMQNQGLKFENGYEFNNLVSSMPFSFLLRAVKNEDKYQKLQEMGVM